MARSKGTLSLSSNIEPSMNAPLDARTVINTLADLTDSGSFPYFYEGMIVSCKANKKVYQLIGDDPTDEENWQEVGSSGGSQVSITPVLTSGRKIADFEIDGEAGELYAPSSSGGSGSVEYAYDEIKVGTWVDGSNVYQIVVPITIPTTSTDGTKAEENTSIGVIIDKLVKFDFVVWGSGWASGLPVWKNISPEYHIRAYVSNDNTVIKTINTCADYSGLQAFAIIQYTKIESTKTPLIPIMTSNTTPSGVASADSSYPNQPAYKAFNRTSNDPWASGAASGETWIQYAFSEPNHKVISFEYNFYTVPDRVSSFSLYGDNTLLLTQNGPFETGTYEVGIPKSLQGSYTTYKLVLATTGRAHVDTFQLYGEEKEIVALIPTMTSNTEPSGEAAASSAQSGADAYRVFDGDKTTYWNCTSATGTVQYQFENPVIITSVYAYVAANNQTVSIEASNDGTNWTTLVESFTLTGGTEETKDVASAAAYTYARATVTKQAGSTAWLHELQFYGYEV